MKLRNFTEKLQIFLWQPNEIPTIEVTQKQNVLVQKILACELALLRGIKTMSEKAKKYSKGDWTARHLFENFGCMLIVVGRNPHLLALNWQAWRLAFNELVNV